MTLVEDCYAGLVWTAEHAEQIGFDAAQLVVAGTSAGGGLAAGTTLLARDRAAPDRRSGADLPDARPPQRHLEPPVRRPSGLVRNANAFGWRSVLRTRPTRTCPPTNPALADDLSGLPTTYVDAATLRSPRRGRHVRHPHLGRRWPGRTARHGRGLPRLRLPLPQAGVSSTARLLAATRSARPETGRRSRSNRLNSTA